MVFSLSKGLILNCFWMYGTLQKADSMKPIQGRLWTLMATVDDLDTRELLEDLDTMALIEMNRRRPRIVLKHVYPPRESVTNTSCNGIHKYLCRDLSGRVFLSHRIVILRTAKFMSLLLSCSLWSRICWMESLWFGGSWMLHGTRNSACPRGSDQWFFFLLQVLLFSHNWLLFPQP